MNKIFKFRAKVIDSDKLDGGRLVYGSLVDHGESNHCPRYWIYPTDGDRNFPVDTNSIAQFVGFDRGGNEIYEGDELIRSDGTKWTAYLEFVCLTFKGFSHDVNFNDFSLVKEDSK